jgi:hypothetical protein
MSSISWLHQLLSITPSSFSFHNLFHHLTRHSAQPSRVSPSYFINSLNPYTIPSCQLLMSLSGMYSSIPFDMAPLPCIFAYYFFTDPVCFHQLILLSSVSVYIISISLALLLIMIHHDSWPYDYLIAVEVGYLKCDSSLHTYFSTYRQTETDGMLSRISWVTRLLVALCIMISHWLRHLISWSSWWQQTNINLRTSYFFSMSDIS